MALGEQAQSHSLYYLLLFIMYVDAVVDTTVSCHQTELFLCLRLKQTSKV